MDTETPVSEPERMEEGSEPEEEEDFTVQVGATYCCKRQDGTYHDAEVVKSRMNKRAGREEFFVHYDGLPCRQNEWVDKTRLVLVNPEDEDEEEEIDEAAEDETSKEKPENGNAFEKQKSDEEEPQPKKIKVDVHEPPANSSLVAPDDFAEELTCPLCIELFKDPVVVECGHNFCRSCLDEAWEDQDSFTCPDCKEVTTDRKYTSNRALANLVKKTATPIKSVVKDKPRLSENCLVHDERLKLFCKDDGDLGCVICRESLKHTNHNFLPILDAVGVYRSELTSIVSPLEDALKVAEKMAEQQNEKIENHKANMLEYQEHIKSEFLKLHQLLKEREEKLLEKLQDEGSSLLMEMEANIAKMQENINNIKESISLANEKLNNSDAIAFLTDIKSFIKKCDEQQKDALSSGNTLIDKELSSDTYKAPIRSSIFEEQEMTVSPSKPKEIWVIGNLMVMRASQVAKNRSYGMNLGLDKKSFTVRWISSFSKVWRQLWKDVSEASLTWGDASVVFIHLGSKEFSNRALQKFIRAVIRDFCNLTKAFPDTTFIWSPIVPHPHWLTTPLEKNRIEFNREVSKGVKERGVQVADFTDVEMAVLKQIKNHWKENWEPMEAFNSSMMESIKKAICNAPKQESV